MLSHPIIFCIIGHWTSLYKNKHISAKINRKSGLEHIMAAILYSAVGTAYDLASTEQTYWCVLVLGRDFEVRKYTNLAKKLQQTSLTSLQAKLSIK